MLQLSSCQSNDNRSFRFGLLTLETVDSVSEHRVLLNEETPESGRLRFITKFSGVDGLDGVVGVDGSGGVDRALKISKKKNRFVLVGAHLLRLVSHNFVSLHFWGDFSMSTRESYRAAV